MELVHGNSFPKAKNMNCLKLFEINCFTALRFPLSYLGILDVEVDNVCIDSFLGNKSKL